MINNVQALIADDEGCKSMPYRDTTGVWTVGIGHNLQANPLPGIVADMLRTRLGQTTTGQPSAYPACLNLITTAQGLMDEEISYLFYYDLGAITGFLNDYPWFAEADDVRQAALQDIAFNLGSTRFHEFGTFLGFCAQSDWVSAAADLQTTLVYKELTPRYSRLCSMLVSGNWP